MRAGQAAARITGACGRLLLFWVFGCAAALADPCTPPPALPEATVSRVVDGDTLRLDDGRRVRLVGIDAPELGRRGAVDQPLAGAARDHLRLLVEMAGARVGLRTGEAAQDRHGRTLAVVYSARHGDLAAHLIRNGLALHAPVPPNLGGSACRAQAEVHAREAGVGLWSGAGAVRDAGTLQRTGFAIVRGRAGEWRERRDDRVLLLDGRVVVRIRDADLARWFDAAAVAGYAGRVLEVRGWVHPWRGGDLAISVRHPSAVAVVPD